MTVEEIIKISDEQNISFIRLQFTDIFGIMKSIAVTRSQIKRILKDGCMFDGSSIEGFARIEESDMRLVPDLDTFVILPFSEEPGRVARLICDVKNPDGTPFEADPRYVLRKVLKRAADMGYICNIGPECEFFLFNLDEAGNPTVQSNDACGYFEIAPMDYGSLTRRSICLALEKMGYEIEASHHESANAQHEIDFKYGEALEIADKIITFKLAVKTIAREKGLYATFMPKPKHGHAGSGMHVNISLMKDGVNTFYDANGVGNLSKTALMFIAGVLKHAKGFTAITNPLINSYKRLVSGYEAPTNIAWSLRNRSPLVRVPVSNEKSARIELRSPDPSCNPYLALAVIIGAGLDGIENQLTPPKSIDANIFKLSKEEKISQSIDALPTSLSEALTELKKDKLIMEILGEQLSSIFINAKREEWSSYRTEVTVWELQHYLSKY
ncbi:MAG: type I glutamate--ammonia ligase [Clostridia bacterium]